MIPQSLLHYQFFAAEPVSYENNQTFEIQLASSGKVIVVGTDQSVAQALAANGVEIPISCEQGVCGTCITRALEDTPDHKDIYFSPEEHAANDQFTPCCSRSKTARLVIDL